QVPPATTAPATVVVRQAGVDSAPQSMRFFVSGAPAIFSVSQNGRGQGAILHAGGGLVSAAAPASAGEVIEVYCTGWVVRECSGCVGPLGESVIIGGVTAEIVFEGPAPGFVGLNQLNVRIPSGVAPGAAVPVRINSQAGSSNEVTIGVR